MNDLSFITLSPGEIPSGLQHGEIVLAGLKTDEWLASEQTLSTSLSRAELERSRDYTDAVQGRRYRVVHGLLRQILGRWLDCDPASLTFRSGQHGKPELEGRTNASFNISHSADRALIALKWGGHVGVDLEQMRTEPDIDGLAQRVFSESELKPFRSASKHEKSHQFLRCWCCKEAALKADGTGFFLEPDELAIDYLSANRARAHWKNESRALPLRWGQWDDFYWAVAYSE